MKTFAKVVTGIFSSVLLSAALLVAAPAHVQGQPPEKAIEAASALSDAFAWVAEHAKPAVVTIVATKYITMPHSNFNFPFFFDQNGNDNEEEQMPSPHRHGRGGRGGGGGGERRYEMEGIGSGVIIDADGYVLTNNHVVKGMDTLKVQFADKREMDAKVIGTDPHTDLAIIKINAKNLPYLPLGDSTALRVGDWVLAIGSPYRLPQTVTAGIVSAKGRQGLLGQNSYEDFIQTDAAINQGNSGGPLLNLHGEIIGINTAIYSESGANAGIGFSIPTSIIKQVLPSLRAGKPVQRGQLGIYLQELDENMAREFGLKETRGVVVVQVTKGSAAEHAGMQPGDVVTQYNGQRIEDGSDLRNRIAANAPGSKSTVTVIRKGRELTLTATLGSAETTTASAATEEATSEKKSLGLTVSNLTNDLAEKLGYKSEKGVVVTDVDANSVAYDKGVREGDLIVEISRQQVTNVSEFEKALESAINSSKEGVLLFVKNKDGSRFVVLKKK